MLTTEFYPSQTTSSRLLVALHGLGDSAAGYRWLPQMLRLPWLDYLLVNAPDPYYGGYSWYDFAENPEPGILRSREVLFHLLDEWRGKGYPTEQTVLLGFSQGCLMVWEMGLRYPHRFNGLVGISGYAHEPQEALTTISPVAKEQRFLITHGTADPLIPFREVRQQAQELKAAGLNVDWREFNKPHTIAGEEELAVIRNFIEQGFSSGLKKETGGL
jgi:predicted esterase